MKTILVIYLAIAVACGWDAYTELMRNPQEIRYLYDAVEGTEWEFVLEVAVCFIIFSVLWPTRIAHWIVYKIKEKAITNTFTDQYEDEES